MERVDRMHKRHRRDSEQIARIAARAIIEKKGIDAAVFDISTMSSLTDYVIIVSGLNAPHLKSLVSATLLRLKKEGVQCYRKSGEPDSGWIIADYLNVMIHFFCREQREYYDMDKMFEQAPELSI